MTTSDKRETHTARDVRRQETHHRNNGTTHHGSSPASSQQGKRQNNGHEDDTKNNEENLSDHSQFTQQDDWITKNRYIDETGKDERKLVALKFVSLQQY
jgi:hypothetical protein